MSRCGASLLAAGPASALSCLLVLFAACQDMPRRGGGPSREFEVTVLSDAVSVQTRRGERLGGYIAEYTLDFQKHRTFMTLEILRYEKGERLAVKGSFIEDSVRMALGDQAEADFPVFRVRRAGPAPPPPIPEIKENGPAGA